MNNSNQPNFKQGPTQDISEAITVIAVDPTGDPFKKTFCEVCKKQVYYDEMIEEWVCTNCGHIYRLKYGEAPLHGTLELRAGNDPYDVAMSRPYFKGFTIEHGDQFDIIEREDEHKRFVGSAQQALEEDKKRVRKLNEKKL
jgi:hypothetical protein